MQLQLPAGALRPRARATAIPARLALLAALSACSGDGAGLAGPASESGTRPTQATEGPPATTTAANPLAGATFWVDPASHARRTAAEWRAGRPGDAQQMDKVGAHPVARWLGNWNPDVRTDAHEATTRMIADGALPVFVAYNIPQRDCGGLSGNNSTSAASYRSWIAALADGIGARRAAVILEPDALAGMDCLSSGDRQQRLELLRYAVQTLTSSGSIAVYLDAGNPRWHDATTMASRLASAGIAAAHGFALNVSNFLGTAENVAYGGELSALVGGKHFVIDTGRNGLGPAADAQWCNPEGRALGPRPTTNTGYPLVDALLWVKMPGESDGACNGGRVSGEWMPEYALGLAVRG
jgi:endoglucanase